MTGKQNKWKWTDYYREYGKYVLYSILFAIFLGMLSHSYSHVDLIDPGIAHETIKNETERETDDGTDRNEDGSYNV